MQTRLRVLWGCGAVAVVAAALIAVAHVQRQPARRLAAAMRAQPSRPFAARLAGAEFRPFPRMRGARVESRSIDLLGAAADVLARPDGDDREAWRTEGIAALVAGNVAMAERQLRRAALAGNRAAWCDLAAAILQRDGDPRAALDAAAAAERGIESGEAVAASHFNLSLAFERLGLVAAARQAFSDSAGLETDPNWRAEATQRRDALPRGNDDADWKAARETWIARAAKGDASGVAEIVHRFPYHARTWSEGVDLSEWGDAILAANAKQAATALQRARMVGLVLREHSGESLLSDAVAAIDALASDAARTRRLAAAHVAYREGRIAHSRHDPSVAVSRLESAAIAFRETKSPMEWMARYYLASSRYDQNDIRGVIEGLDVIAAMQPVPRGYLVLDAQTGWERGLCLLLQGSYSSALQILTRSRDVLARVDGHGLLIPSMDSLIAETLDYIGDDEGAWHARARALDELSRFGGATAAYRIHVTLLSAARTLVRREEWERARVILDALLATGGDADADPMVLCQVHAQRSVARDRLGDLAGAEQDRASAIRYAGEIRDVQARGRAEAEIDESRGLAALDREPAAAIAHLTRAVDFFRREQPAHLPRILLERGRASLRLHRIADARVDFEDGLSVIEQARSLVSDLELRAMTAYWSRALYAHAIAAALDARDSASAFHLSERARARALLERLEQQTGHPPAAPMTLAEVQNAIAPTTTIIEYADLPDGVVAFVVRADALDVVRLNASTAEIQDATAKLVDADEEAGTVAMNLLLTPLRHFYSDRDDLVFVASQRLSRAAFGLLYDARTKRFLCETSTILHAPSATIVIIASRNAARKTGDDAVIIGGNAFDPARDAGLPPLATVSAEARRIAATRPGSIVLTDDAARTEAVKSAIRDAAIVHFAGHIVGFGSDAQMVLAARDALSARNVARMSLPRTRLVVLAGCRAADSRASDGVSDLATAFLVAGASTVIGTTTDLDDAIAPELFGRIHEALRDSPRELDAIRMVASQPGLTLEQRRAIARLIMLGGSETLLR